MRKTCGRAVEIIGECCGVAHIFYTMPAGLAVRNEQKSELYAPRGGGFPAGFPRAAHAFLHPLMGGFSPLSTGPITTTITYSY